MTIPRLLLITDDQPRLLLRLEMALAGGVRHVLLRAKGQSAEEVWQTARKLLPLVREVGGRLLIHDRLDVALALAADGVHLPGNGLPVSAARQLLGSTFLLGRSCHTPEEVVHALDLGADYVTLSPVFATSSHPGKQALGLGQFARWRCLVSGPVLALGGIHHGNVSAVLKAGADGVALISGILGQEDPCDAARKVVSLVQAGQN